MPSSSWERRKNTEILCFLHLCWLSHLALVGTSRECKLVAVGAHPGVLYLASTPAPKLLTAAPLASQPSAQELPCRGGYRRPSWTPCPCRVQWQCPKGRSLGLFGTTLPYCLCSRAFSKLSGLRSQHFLGELCAGGHCGLLASTLYLGVGAWPSHWRDRCLGFTLAARQVESALPNQLSPVISFVGEGAGSQLRQLTPGKQHGLQEVPFTKAKAWGSNNNLDLYENYLYIITKILIAHSAVCLN